MHLPTLLFLVPLLSTAVIAQTAGTTAPLIYTYAGNSVSPSLLDAINTAGAPASALNAASGKDTATGLVPAMATTATAEPATIPRLTGSMVFSSPASGGQVLSTATRPMYTAIGTINTSMAPGTATATARSSASRVGVEGGLVLSVIMALGGVAAGAMCL